jgi:hypothetical protein
MHFYFDTFTLSAVPEPGSVVLAGLGLTSLAWIANRRKKIQSNKKW